MNNALTFDRFSSKWLIPVGVLSVPYWLWFGLFVGVGSTEIMFYVVVVALCFISYRTRQLTLGFLPLYIYLICYSSLKVLHRTDFFSIHNEDLYLLEKKLFGIGEGVSRMIPCEHLNANSSTLMDVISGSFYITWMPFPFIFGFILFFSNRKKLLFDFWMSFLIANILGFIGYIIYPAAPPWYYLEYGAQIIHNAPPSAAGLARFDQIIGLDLYQNMYSQSTNTFGAMPSMHAAFPLILSYYSFKYKNKWLSTLFVISMISIWFGAIYSNHHYILDVLAGISCGIIGILLTESWVNGKFAPLWYKKTVNYLLSDPKT